MLSWSGYPCFGVFVSSEGGVRSGSATPPVFPLWQSLHVISFAGLRSPVWIRSTGCLYAFEAKFCVGMSFPERWQKSHEIGYPPVAGNGTTVSDPIVGIDPRMLPGMFRMLLEPARIWPGFRL